MGVVPTGSTNVNPFRRFHRIPGNLILPRTKEIPNKTIQVSVFSIQVTGFTPYFDRSSLRDRIVSTNFTISRKVADPFTRKKSAPF